MRSARLGRMVRPGRRHGTKVLLSIRRLSALITAHVSNHLMKFLKTSSPLSVALFTTAQAVQTTVRPHQRHADRQADRAAQAGRVLVEAAALAERSAHGAGERSRADHARVSQRHPHRPLDREHRLEGPRHAGRRLQHSREKAGALLEEIRQRADAQHAAADWTGICMHSGNLPGYPASHGCIRMPFDFSQLLFSATSKGGTVVVGDGKTPVPHLASSPGLMLAPKDFTPADAASAREQ